MEAEGSIPDSKGLSNNPYHLDLFVNILKTLLPSSILATCPALLNLVDLIALTN